MIVSFLMTSLGFMFVHRILGSSLHKIGLLNRHSQFFVVFAALMTFVFLIDGLHPLQLWLIFGTIFIFLKLLPYFFSRYLEKLIQSHTLRILDHLILSVQSGLSLRTSLMNLSRREPSLLRVPLKNLAHALVQENSSEGLKLASLRTLYEELKRIEKSQSKCGDQLRAFRKQVKTLEDFRRRSGQVTLQIRMQSAISALLYVALLLFMITQFGFLPYRGLILFSAALFAAGVVTVFVIGRRLRWTT